MPTYSYQCKKCGHVQDVFHAMSANPRVKCPECGGQCKRLLGTGAGIIFKGSGFYETDYKRSGASGTGSSPAPSAKSGDKGESKSSKSPAKESSNSSSGDST